MEAALLKALSRDPAARHDTVHGLMFELRGLQSVRDRSPADADDNHSTVPMVGTLAEKGSIARKDLETLERMSAPPVEGPSLEVFETIGESGISVQITLHEERFAQAASSAPCEEASVAAHDSASAAQTPKADAAPARTDSAARAQAPEPAAASPSPDTPMSGESDFGVDNRGQVSRTGARTAVLALVVSGATVLAGAGVAGFSRGSGAKGAKPIDRRMPGEGVAASELASERPRPRIEASSASDGGVELAASAWLGSAPTVAETAVRPPAGGPGAAPVRKPTPSAARPAARNAALKPPIPDDGRDELYVPGER
jgi:hypothetical protein